MSKVDTLAALVVAVPVEGGEPGEVEYTVECPHCKAQGLDIIREVDTAVRWNTGELEIEDGKIVGAYWGTGDTTFEHEAYECQQCDNPVSLPDDIGEDWS